MNQKYFFRFLLIVLVISAITGCKKFLDTKQNQRIASPDTLKDLQALLDNEGFYKRGIGLSQTSADEYFVEPSYWENLGDLQRLGYIWDPALDDYEDWLLQYLNVLSANVVLDRLKDIGDGSVVSNSIKGSALFLRAQCFYQLAQLYALQYDKITAATDPGIVLRLDPDFNKPSQRASVAATYEQIINDLKETVDLLPVATVSSSRPTKAAAYGLLARAYLQTGDYAKAKEAADNSLQIYNYLIDYNDATEVDTTSLQPFLKKGILNKEIIFYLVEDASVSINSQTRIDTNLYRSYSTDDIRRAAFFHPFGDGTFKYKGSYNGSVAFVGIGTAEIFLIRAESNARLGNTGAALQDLNTLLIRRYKTGTFVPVTASSAEQALTIILSERKKEMLFRGMRWADLRRLNKEPDRAITLKRILNGQEYHLPPNDLRYTLLIPQSVLELSNLQQNPR